MHCRIIINADDFGLTQDVNQAIWELARCNTLSSTNVMANMPDADAITDVAADQTHLGIGVHINLTQGKPISKPGTVPSLVDQNGDFFPRHKLVHRALRGRIALDDCKREIYAQVVRVRDLIGSRPDHWNSHQGIHRYEPITGAAIAVCRDASIVGMRTHRHRFLEATAQEHPTHRQLIRWAKENYYRYLSWRSGRHFALADGILVIRGKPTVDTIQFLTHGKLPDGTWELVCHPAKSSAGLVDTSMTASRVDEYQLLVSKQFQMGVANGTFALIRYADLAARLRKDSRR